MVHRPEGRNAPDYASKIHIVSAPAYYHNYMMGELFADQVLARDRPRRAATASSRRKASFVGNKAVGDFLEDPSLRTRAGRSTGTASRVTRPAQT